jgi:alpha-galactosidase
MKQRGDISAPDGRGRAITRRGFGGLLLASASLQSAPSQLRVDGKNVRLEFDRSVHSRVVAILGGKEIPIGPFTPSESIRVGGKNIAEFAFSGQKREAFRDHLGSGRRFLISGTAASLRKTVMATVYDEFPRMIFLEVQYTNTGNSALAVEGWANHQYSVAAGASRDNVSFWSLNPGSYQNRPVWVLPLKAGFQQENYLGMNASDYGGGTPVADVWRPDVGIGVGHIELVPKLVSLPVAMPDAEHASLGLEYKYLSAETLPPGDSLKTFRSFVAVHQGDHFGTLREYRRVMLKQGVTFKPAPESAFGPIWCGWGYGRDFTAAQIYGALPIAKKLGFTWATLDDGWQTREGDWFLSPKRFPNGEPDMKAMVNRFHEDGLRAQLWWAPMLAGPESELIKNHPEMLLLNANGSKQDVPYWKSWYLCPADPNVVEYFRNLVVKMIRDWGYDGLKLDGQHMNGAPPCYNPVHKHARPEESVEAMPKFFKMIYDTALSIKPDALVEWCPCGTSFNFFTLPYLNMSVASDPGSSLQVRMKGKTLKALHGDSIAYFGDHVSLSPRSPRPGQPARPQRDDFASTVGIGGVLGTNFTWPPGSAGPGRTSGELTPDKEQLFEKWLKIYRDKMLCRGEYLGSLYDVGFDQPETHAVRKGGNLYYAFFAPEYKGQVELRGLGGGRYRVSDYENGTDLGTVSGPLATMDIQFNAHLLLDARPA